MLLGTDEVVSESDPDLCSALVSVSPYKISLVTNVFLLPLADSGDFTPLLSYIDGRQAKESNNNHSLNGGVDRKYNRQESEI